METSYLGSGPVENPLPPPSVTESPAPSSGTNKGRYLLYAIGIILLIGSIIANGLLFSQLGYASFAIGGVGFVSAIVCFLIGKYLCVDNARELSMPSDPYRFRARVFQETLDTCNKGYYTYGTNRVIIDNKPMLDSSFSGVVTSIGPGARRTKFSVVENDTLNELLRLRASGTEPVGINMANARRPGGGVVHGASAQEESLCRRSNLYLALQAQRYPLQDSHVIYTPHVKVFRNDEAHGFSFMEQPQEVALVSVAAFDLSSGSEDLTKLKLRSSSIDELKSNIDYISGTKAKIRNTLRTMAGHTHIVLGALGCGAFKNPPELMAQLFEAVLNEPEFHGHFEEVRFAILKLSPSDQANIEAFSKACANLNATYTSA
jgi:uncharacterized protein (TIGR02452 family)